MRDLPGVRGKVGLLAESCMNAQYHRGMTPMNACRHCGATSYRQVIARDGRGVMSPSGRFQCCGCRLVFDDLRLWRRERAGDAPLAYTPAPAWPA
ncbi:MAG: hypothetical protein RJA98_1855 [Pseudomonadota bacterium]|jgi:hypothetical protein